VLVRSQKLLNNFFKIYKIIRPGLFSPGLFYG
jgi:hypothetical protein